MPARSTQWAELLTPQTTAAFWTGFSGGGRRQSAVPAIYNQTTSQRAFEEHIGAGVLGSDGWNQFEKTGRVSYDDSNKGFKTTFTHVEFAKGHIVQRKLVDDNRFPEILRSARLLGDSAFRKMEKSGASVFANAFTSTTNADGFSTLGGDSATLCSASHPLSPSDSTNQSNTGTSALSKTSVAATRIAMQKFTDDRGDITDCMPDTILIPPDLEDTAIEIGQSPLDPVSANNAVNPQAGRFRTIVWHYLTDTNNWFMIDSGRMNESLLWYNRIPLEYGAEEDFDTLQAKFRGYARYSYGWTDPLFIYGHNVT